MFEDHRNDEPVIFIADAAEVPDDEGKVAVEQAETPQELDEPVMTVPPFPQFADRRG